MSLIWTSDGPYRHVAYESEAELESAIQQVQSDLFGSNRIYLDKKKKIGARGGLRNIPDGYLIDLSGQKPRLYVVEVELSSHEPLRHIAVQILEFSLSFEAEPRAVKRILFDALQSPPDAMQQCEAYASEHGFRNLDHMLEFLVFEGPFAALVIIDEIPEDLENVLARKFQFGVEVIELARYKNRSEKVVYRFEPFLADLREDLATETALRDPSEQIDASEIDTVVVPARDEGFQAVCVGENCWHAIRLHGSMRPQIKHIAA